MCPELAKLTPVLNSVEDAGICWGTAVGNQGPAPAEWCWHWFLIEAKNVAPRPEAGFSKGRSWVSRATLSGGKNREVPGEDLDKLLDKKKTPEPPSADLRAPAAYLVWPARRERPA